jgi:YaiO family outer membrane protein
MSRQFYWTLSVFYVMLLPGFLFAQSAQVGDYGKMKEAAHSGKYKTAAEMGKSILVASPNNHDVAVLLARVYIWQQQYDSAQTVLNNLLSKAPGYADGVEAQFDLDFFSANYNQVLASSDSLIASNPARIDFKEKKALSHLELGQKSAALNDANAILSIDPENKVALGIVAQLKPKPGEVTVGYFFDQFQTPYHRWWNVYTLGYTKPLDWGSLAARLNLGHLGDFSNQGLEPQVEVESNIVLSKSAYMMLLYGYSPSIYFPKHKASAEVWHTLPYQFVGSVGGSYYYWADPIFIATFSLEKYYNDYWFCLRNYLQFKDIGVTASFYFTARKYFGDVDYFQAMLGYGAAPDEPFDVSDLNRQNAASIRLAYLKQLSQRIKLRAALGYSYEEYQQGDFRNRYEGGLSLFYTLAK